MPIYQYQCADCGHQMEALQKMSDPKLTDCPECKGSGLRKQVTAAAFKLKGTGWYETDFKNSGSKPAAKANDSSKASDSSSDAKSSDSKPSTAKPASSAAAS